MWIIDKDIYIELQITRLPCSSIFLGSVEIDRIDLFVHMSRVLRKQPIESIGLVYLPTLMVYLFMVFMYLESQVPYF